MVDIQGLYRKAGFARAHRFMTNCYSMDTIEHAGSVWELGDSFVFSYEDHGIDRLVFFASDWDALNVLIGRVDGKKYYLEYMTKDTVDQSLQTGALVTRMLRMANSDCRSVFGADSKVLQYRGAGSVERATEQDAEEVTKLLWETFRTEVSHLLYADEMVDVIRAGQLTVHRTDGRIDALLQAKVMPKNFYINQIVNRGARENVHALLLDRLEDYVSKGGKYLYAWVEETNVASIRFHNKYGLEHDGMYSLIFCIGGQ